MVKGTCSRRGLHLTGQTTINQNVGAVACLNEVADEREVPLRVGCYLHQIEPLRCSAVRVRMVILSLWLKHSTYLVCSRWSEASTSRFNRSSATPLYATHRSGARKRTSTCSTLSRVDSRASLTTGEWISWHMHLQYPQSGRPPCISR